MEGIKKCHLIDFLNNKTAQTEISLQCEGVNFTHVFKYEEFIDINKIKTNDIGSILGIYGVIRYV